MKVELNFSTDLAAAPVNKLLVGFGPGGWRFVRVDDLGNWRNNFGALRSTPKCWAEWPDIAVEDGE